MNFHDEIALAFHLFEENKLNEAIKLYNSILTNRLTIAEEIQVRYAYGYPLSQLGLVEEAIENYVSLEKIGRDYNDMTIVSQATHQLGMVYRQNGQYERALGKFHEERQLIEKYFREHLLFKAANYYELGYTNLLTDKFNEAYSYLNLSLDLALKTKDLIMIACTYRALGEYYSKQNNPEKSITHFNISIQNFEQVSDSQDVLEVKALIKNLSNQ